MREKLRQFMIGRYGTDGLNQFLSIASLALLLIAIISRVNLFTYLATTGEAGRAVLHCRMEGALDTEAVLTVRRREGETVKFGPLS